MKCKRSTCLTEAATNPYRGTLPLYCSKSCKTKDAVNTLRRRRKAEAVEYKGGKCSKCGYDKSIAALQFHHRDPTQKEFSLHSGVTMSMERVKEELDKCDLLCANCHAEVHVSLAELD